jgi:LuxR family transcriptional regulator, maltose regulon positive regulatory protein
MTAQAIVIRAPAGYGKTVLAKEWAQRRPNVAWYRSTSASADLAAFAAGIAASVARILPGAGGRVRQQLRVTDGSDHDPTVLAESLAADLEAWPANGVLVIDDYHLVQESRPVEEFVDRLLAVSRIRLLVTTRARPAWAAARRMLYGEVAEIGSDLLAMTDDEASQVLRDLPPHSARRAVIRSRGWPAVIGLAALTSARAVPDVTVSDALYRYFAEEVLRRETPEVQRFMLLASVPATVDATLARDLLGFSDPDDVLERLVAEGLLEASDGTFRFHLLVREFLRRKLESEAPEELRELAARAVTASVERGRLEDAVELALENRDVERAAELAARAAPGLLIAGRIETLERWLEACGAAALEQPPLVLARAAILIRRGALAEAADEARRVAERLPEDDPDASRAWYLTAQALHQLGRREEALESASRAAELGRGATDRMNALVLCVLSAAALELDDAEYLRELKRLAGDDIQVAFRWASAAIWSALTRPSLKGVWDEVEPVLRVVERCEGPMLKSDVLSAAAYLSVLRAEYTTAAELAERAVGVCADFRLRLNHVFAVLYLAFAEIGRHRYRRAEALMRSVRESRYATRPGVHITLAIAELKLAVARGRLVEDGALDDSVLERTSRRSRGVLAALRAMAAAGAGDSSAYPETVAAARAASTGVEATFYSRYADLLQALHGEVPVQPAKITALIQETADAEIVDALVVAYRADPRLLTLAGDDRRTTSIARRAVTGAGDEALARAAGLIEAPSKAPPAPLTRRELEVLSLMGEGLSNIEIARRLYISPSTTKVHVHHILEKLRAKSRTEAVLEGQRRGMTGTAGR